MGKKSIEQLAVIDLTEGKQQPFARKVVVIAYHLEKLTADEFVPHFLLTVITPKQSPQVIANWEKARRYRLPSGFSLIKGTREMVLDGQEQDIPPAFNKYFKKAASGRLKPWRVDYRVDGPMPALLTALKESREEAGVKPGHIKQIFDFGVRRFRQGKRSMPVNCFAIEMKKPAKGKAIDSLALEYFTLSELKLASQQLTRYNIPLVRPAHYGFVDELFSLLKQQYRQEGKQLKKKALKKSQEGIKIKQVKVLFKRLVKYAGKGQFTAHKYSTSKTIKNIIAKSKKSHKKRKKTPQSA